MDQSRTRESIPQSRKISLITRGEQTSDGGGVQLRRIVGTSDLSYLDPFLLLDEFKNDDPEAYSAGFPSHPHRGFETVTYLIEGRMRHKDSHGHEGVLSPGDVQWMTAGRGIVHSEIPEIEDGMLWGYQLWVNLPARAKMNEPAYQEIPSEEIPVIRTEEKRIRVIAGEYQGRKGKAETLTPITYLDVRLEGGAQFEMEPPSHHNMLIYMIEGKVYGGEEEIVSVSAGELAAFGPGKTLFLENDLERSRFLYLSGEPIGEPVARGGPFVMNTREEVIQAYRDYEAGRF